MRSRIPWGAAGARTNPQRGWGGSVAQLCSWSVPGDPGCQPCTQGPGCQPHAWGYALDHGCRPHIWCPGCLPNHNSRLLPLAEGLPPSQSVARALAPLPLSASPVLEPQPCSWLHGGKREQGMGGHEVKSLGITALVTELKCKLATLTVNFLYTVY